MATDIVPIPIGWLLASIGGLAACIGTLAGIIFAQLNSRIKAQDAIIAGLQADVNRLSKGCGMATCAWRSRN